MKVSRYFILILFLVASTVVTGQYQLSTGNKKAAKQYREAEQHYRSNEYDLALENLDNAIKKDKKFIEAYLLRGDIFTELHEKEKAIKSFETAISIDPAFFPLAYFFIGNLAYELGSYGTSVDYLTNYLEFNDENEESRIIAQTRLKKAQQAKWLFEHPLAVQADSTVAVFNTPADDYINFVDEEYSQLYLTRKQLSGETPDGRPLFKEKFYWSQRDTAGWTGPGLVSPGWMKDLDAGGITLSTDGRKMYFTGCNWPGGFGSCDLYVSSRNGKEWEAPTILSQRVNSQWWDSQPAISSDGKKIFFSSKRKGGKGGSDIWMAVKLPNGKWSPPVNLGDSINTGGNEMAPFLHADGKTLYFSSDGHAGLGGADLYISRRDELGRWSKARNVGYPINTRFNEINLFMGLDGDRFYLSSDKPGGEGGFNIYSYFTPDELRPTPVYYVKGFVKDKETGHPLRAEILVTNLNEGTAVYSFHPDATDGSFLIVLQYGIPYAFHISKPGYLLYSENFTHSEQKYLRVNKTFFLDPVKKDVSFILNNVFFDFDKSDLKPESYIELDKVYRFLNENSEVSIMITGHTDNQGSENYNLQLSEERAKAVADYLISKGVDKERVSSHGEGASRPVDSNDTEEGRARNRRTEVRIL